MEGIPEGKIVPIEAYRYWPKESYIYTGTGKSIVRYIFYNIEFTDFELTQLELFKNYIKEKEPNLQLTEFFVDQELIRMLLGCKFCMKKSLLALQSAIKWRCENLAKSFFSILPFCERLLNSGFIYFHGRDHRFRPLLVLNIEKLDLVNNTVIDYCNLLCFLLEFAIQKLLLPGQIENWIVITDLNNKGLSDLPISSLKNIIKVLQDNFRCRMIVNYIVNAPSSLYFFWSIIKKFIEEHTIKKIRILKESTPVEISSHFAKTQVEIKYGGSSPNLTSFWPPCFPPGPFSVEGENIENILSDISTYHIYNVTKSEISSEMGEITEDVNIILPDIPQCSLYFRDFKYENIEHDFRQITLSQRLSLDVIASPKSNYSQLYSLRNSRKSSIFESPQKELVDEEMENIPERVSNIGLVEENEVIEDREADYRIKETFDVFVDEQKNEPSQTRLGRICKFCSKKRCEIW
ncbi:hypothetical protein SteCoe_29678 [Stentor coeruleus]|uniref:CRAL-TRIO domain-containing protein n=1 Tax=Stentor coeruleus TaxID=5963 RepID=A0A1R2B5D3_9CILI|nr:hypothetical protein SteCoe_29678 [Stentor coeruleus]